MALGPLTFSMSILDAQNRQLIRSDCQAFVATDTNMLESDIAVTTTPTAYNISLPGTTPVTLFIYNPNAVNLTVLGVAGFTQIIPPGMFGFVPNFVSSSNLTLSLASGTGTAYVLVLK